MFKILEGIVGSTAYGLATPDSDIDRAGIFVSPTKEILSLDKPKESIVNNDGLNKSQNPDTSYHEVEKFLRLALNANPTVSELLWLNDYETLTDEGKMLVEVREQFISQLARATYGGYARQQFKRLKERGSFSSTLRNRTGKHARHMWRLMIQGERLLTCGEIRVQLTEDEAAECRYFGVLAESVPRLFNKEAERRLSDFDNCKTSVPGEPNREAANDILLTIRRAHFNV